MKIKGWRRDSREKLYVAITTGLSRFYDIRRGAIVERKFMICVENEIRCEVH